MQTMDRVQPVLVLAGRIFLGLLLALVLSMVGIGVAWGLFVFAGAVSKAALLSFVMAGAGIGAALGSFIAWLRMDRNPLPLFLSMGLVLLLAGIGGAWGGYYFGANQEVPCCAKPDITPFTYIAFGATVVANGAALVVGIAREIAARR